MKISKDIGSAAADATNNVGRALREVADDLAALKIAAAAAATAVTVATANAAAQTGAYVQADVETIRTLANSLKVELNKLITDVADIRTKIGTVAAVTILTTKA